MSRTLTAKVTRDPIMLMVITEIHNSPMTIRQISDKSGVSEQTMRNWIRGKTRYPQAVTLCFVLRAMGLDLVIRPIAGSSASTYHQNHHTHATVN